MPPMAAYEVASFYNMYDLKPVGKYKITVCTNLPCALSGGYHAGEYQRKLGITLRRNDGRRQVHAEGGRVHGRLRRCAGLIVNNRSMCSHMHPEQIDKLLEESNNGNAWF